MKYSREDVKSMYPITYRELICEELNNAGFQHEFQGEWMGYTPDYSTFGGVIVKDGQAVRYLKMIGLINNGKCPWCGEREDTIQYSLTPDHGVSFHVCKRCYNQHCIQERHKRGCCSCIVLLIFITLAISGIIKLLK